MAGRRTFYYTYGENAANNSISSNYRLFNLGNSEEAQFFSSSEFYWVRDEQTRYLNKFKGVFSNSSDVSRFSSPINLYALYLGADTISEGPMYDLEFENQDLKLADFYGLSRSQYEQTILAIFSGNDEIVGSSDSDTPDDLFGYAGNDLMLGKGGNDKLSGGEGDREGWRRPRLRVLR